METAEISDFSIWDEFSFQMGMEFQTIFNWRQLDYILTLRQVKIAEQKTNMQSPF